MKQKLLALTLGLVVSGLTSQLAQAVPITGGISFTGGVTLNTASAGTATAVTAWTSATVLTSTLSAGPAAGAAVFAAPWTFASGPLAAFWSVSGYTFDLISSAITMQGSGAVFVAGTGTLKKAGFDPTLGSWSFTTQDPAVGGTFSFSASEAFVPEGGSALAMLGLGLIGLGALRKKLARKA